MSDDPHQEDDYRESEDEDYNPDKTGVDDDDVNHSGSESEEDEKEQKIPAAEVSAVDTSEKRQTRSQQLAQARDQPITIEKSTSGIDIDSLWASMNSKPPSKTASPTTTDPANGPISEEYITIKRTIKFAGKVTHEEKRVLASSAEGKAYLKEQQEPVRPAKKQPPRKRKSSLLEELESGKAKKINTLEKSRLDWLGFVDKEGIREDLTKHNKGGYLHKQDFLSRVEHKIHDDMTANKKKKP